MAVPWNTCAWVCHQESCQYLVCYSGIPNNVTPANLNFNGSPEDLVLKICDNALDGPTTPSSRNTKIIPYKNIAQLFQLCSFWAMMWFSLPCHDILGRFWQRMRVHGLCRTCSSMAQSSNACIPVQAFYFKMFFFGGGGGWQSPLPLAS